MNAQDFETQLQRLVDAELDHGSRCRFLNQIPNASANWRKIAVAFVEQQLMNEALGRSRLADSAATAVPNSIEVAARNPLERVQTPVRRRAPGNPSWWTTLTICIFLGFVSGLFWSNRSAAKPESGPGIIRESRTPEINRIPAASNITGELELADALARSSQPLPVEFRRELMKFGYLITERDQISKVELPTGHWIEMPVRTVAVRFLGTNTYQ
jgi:hypothetical protein